MYISIALTAAVLCVQMLKAPHSYTDSHTTPSTFTRVPGSNACIAVTFAAITHWSLPPFLWCCIFAWNKSSPSAVCPSYASLRLFLSFSAIKDGWQWEGCGWARGGLLQAGCFHSVSSTPKTQQRARIEQTQPRSEKMVATLIWSPLSIYIMHTIRPVQPVLQAGSRAN